MKKNKLSKSFYQDINIEEKLSSDILDIYLESKGYKKSKLRETLTKGLNLKLKMHLTTARLFISK